MTGREQASPPFLLLLKLFLPFAGGYCLYYPCRTVNAITSPDLGREEVGSHLLVMALDMMVGAALWGSVADRLSRDGVDMVKVLLGGALAYMVVLALVPVPYVRLSLSRNAPASCK
jgi:hypothetical protein